MTGQTTHPADARPSCMVAALDNIRAAQKLKLEPGTKNRVREPLPELYWSLMAEAAIYAELARADVSVGFAAGAHLVQRDERIREQKRLFADRAAQRHPHRAAADAMTDGAEAGHGIPTFDNGDKGRTGWPARIARTSRSSTRLSCRCRPGTRTGPTAPSTGT